jgi:ribosome biogenesis GTPase A
MEKSLPQNTKNISETLGKHIQWYPGHIAKLERQLDDLLKRIDVVIEVLDARIPRASVNPRIREIYLKKRPLPVVVLFNKADLADPVETDRWMAFTLNTMAKHFPMVTQAKCLPYQATGQGHQKQALIQACVSLSEEKMQKIIAKGMKRRPIRTLIVGMPNVGKSTLINNIIGIKKTRTGHKAGVTRQPQWVRIHPQLELLDTPGLIPPTLSDPENGMLLACVSSIGEAAFDDNQVACFLLQEIHRRYPGRLHQQYHLNPESCPLDQVPLLEDIAAARKFLKPGQILDVNRAAQHVLADFRQGNWARCTLQSVLALPPDKYI